MLKTKEKNDIKSTLLLINFLNIHINKCKKLVCNCKLLRPFINNKYNNNSNDKYYSQKLLSILNYLFECAFIELDYTYKYELAILLSEHFCHLKDNPIMAFSLINTLILKKHGKFSFLQMITLYELAQKYLYFLSAKINLEVEIDLKKDKKELLKHKLRSEEMIIYYTNLKLSYKVKKLIFYYIDNQIKILKYKNIFEDSLSVQYDENNENIISIKILFFHESSKIDNIYNNLNHNHKYKNIKQKNQENIKNLYFIVYLLNEEHFYHFQIVESINQMEIKQTIPVFIIFKFFLFFDIFCGGKMPKDIPDKLYNSLSKERYLYNSDITKKEYSILIKKYKEQNNRINSKYYAIFEYKKELIIKYYNEECALKLGYKQKDLINQKIDELMPNEFANSHQNVVKQMIIFNQIRHFKFFKNYFFNSCSSILYPVNYDGILIFNISKYLNIIFEWSFILDSVYQFMLNSNFELIANSKNFEEEYFLNKNIFQFYNINLLDIIKIKPGKLAKNFEKEMKNITLQKYIRQVKTEEYFIPQFYVPLEEKNLGMMNQLFFNISKNNILAKSMNLLNKEYIDINDVDEDENSYNYNYDDVEEDEIIKLMKKNNLKKNILDIFINKGEINFHQTYNTTINKLNFVKNITKELSKIEDYELNYEDEKNNYNYNLIIAAKQLSKNLLKRFEISNHFLKIKIQLSYYYDKTFYFISIDDYNKYSLNLSNQIILSNNQKFPEIRNKNTSSSLGKNSIAYNKNDKNSRNRKFSNQNNNLLENRNKYNNELKKKIDTNNKIEILKNYMNELDNNEENKNIMNKINEYRYQINRDKFIYIIKIILFIIIVCILVIYSFIIYFSVTSTNIKEIILLTHFYNLRTKDCILNVHSQLLQMFYDHTDLAKNPISGLEEYKDIMKVISITLKDNYHNFTNNFYEYNLKIKHDFNLIYLKKKYIRLRGFWKEIEYESEYSSELDHIIYIISSINISNAYSTKSIEDRINFIFFKGRNSINKRPNSPLIKLLYYLCINYEFVYKQLYIDFEKLIFTSFDKYNYYHIIIYIILEALGAILFIIFFIIVIFFLYFSNEVIIKNIIFLFLDFSEDLNSNKNNRNIITLKLLELQYLINDFNLIRLEKYSNNIEKINKNKPIFSINDNNENLSSFNVNDNYQNEENKNEQGNKSLNQSEKTSARSKSKNTEGTNKKFIKLKSKKIVFEKKSTLETKDINNRYDSIKNNKVLNNSSRNNLVDTNSQFFKDKLNNNSISASNDFLSSSNNIDKNNSDKNNNSKKINLKENINIVNKNTSLKNTINEEYESFQDIILKESKKNQMFIIKIYIIIILIFIFLTIGLGIYKFISYLRFNSHFTSFFINFGIITNRYNILYYYFNIFRTLLIFPIDKRKERFEDTLENLNEYYESENINFNNVILNNMKLYKETYKLIEILKKSKEGCTDILKEKICLNESICLNYLDSKYNIFDSGVDFAFQICIKQINNLFMEYKKLNNKTDISYINNTIINSENSQFINIGLSLSNIFYYVKEKIFESFRKDEIIFKLKNIALVTLLNFISIIFSIISILFINIFIFITLYNFSHPIKESTYRINCSFYNIKKYKLNINIA